MRAEDSLGKKTWGGGGGNGGIKFGDGGSDQVQMWGYYRAGIRNDIPPHSIFQSVLFASLSWEKTLGFHGLHVI